MKVNYELFETLGVMSNYWITGEYSVKNNKTLSIRIGCDIIEPSIVVDILVEFKTLKCSILGRSEQNIGAVKRIRSSLTELTESSL